MIWIYGGTVAVMATQGGPRAGATSAYRRRQVREGQGPLVGRRRVRRPGKFQIIEHESCVHVVDHETRDAIRFIEEVDPKQVIFPSGHVHHHPNCRVYKRYRKAGVDKSDMFRTDRGDNEGKPE